ncbi:MAG: HNH endonuclease signature motif containing protein [Armatimonadota bacterium]|nr:HNH endonuclease signature motif containing protein [Armatimonadota bacterium]
MPPRYVKTVEDVIHYYYSRLVIAPSAGLGGNWGFITHTFKRLKSGEISMSDYDREVQKQMEELPEQCVYCGAEGPLTRDHVIPIKCRGPNAPHNCVYVCKQCNSSKGICDVVDWWVNHVGNDLSDLPRLVAGIYLKFCYDAHKMEGTLDRMCNELAGLWPYGPSAVGGRD